MQHGIIIGTRGISKGRVRDVIHVFTLAKDMADDYALSRLAARRANLGAFFRWKENDDGLSQVHPGSR